MAYLEMANSRYGGADVALQSGGGVRQALNGDVTAADVIEVVPFGNTLYRVDVSGEELRSMVEDGLDAVFRADNASTGPYPYTAGSTPGCHCSHRLATGSSRWPSTCAVATAT